MFFNCSLFRLYNIWKEKKSIFLLYILNTFLSLSVKFTKNKLTGKTYTFSDPTVEVSGISINSSGTLKDLIVSFTAQKRTRFLESHHVKIKDRIEMCPKTVYSMCYRKYYVPWKSSNPYDVN